MPRGLSTAAVALCAAAAVALLGGVLAGGPAAARPPDDSRLLGELLSGLETGRTADYVRRLDQQPRAAGTLTLLGLAYQQRFRETGDPSYLSRSERALREAGAGGLVTAGRAALAATRHDFRQALVLAREALRADPESPAALGALGDALAGLGRYREAFAAFDRMAELAPSIASYSRVAHARELIGRPAAAAEALELALELEPTVPEYAAAALVQLGRVYANSGRIGDARRAYRRALARVPGYVRAEAGLAWVEAAAGDYASSARRLRGVVDRLPLPEYAIRLTETLETAGRRAEAERAERLVEAIERLLRANGVRTELQTALFDLDRGHRLAGALARAREAHRAAPNIFSEDVLAWALARNGRCGEALAYSRRSLRLGTRDALLFFHRGMIERCLGRRAEARTWFRRALAVNPHFSLIWSPVAARGAR
ncbi:MAG: tetratricopeptide repeat protein [Gaiellaceae bacterium]